MARANARLLILGSLPGRRSLDAREYYAHPRNAFWPIMAELAAATGSYEQRCAALVDAGIALWDVLQTSQRPGSLDANIRLASARPNDFVRFFRIHRSIRRVLFNGRKAQQLFHRLVPAGELQCEPGLVVLPSTSPAYAAMPYAEKLERWRRAMR